MSNLRPAHIQIPKGMNIRCTAKTSFRLSLVCAFVWRPFYSPGPDYEAQIELWTQRSNAQYPGVVLTGRPEDIISVLKEVITELDGQHREEAAKNEVLLQGQPGHCQQIAGRDIEIAEKLDEFDISLPVPNRDKDR